jgi:hypothetical protein
MGRENESGRGKAKESNDRTTLFAPQIPLPFFHAPPPPAHTAARFVRAPPARAQGARAQPGTARGPPESPAPESTHISLSLCRMEVAHQYNKKRSAFGHHAVFEDVPSSILESVPQR